MSIRKRKTTTQPDKAKPQVLSMTSHGVCLDRLVHYKTVSKSWRLLMLETVQVLLLCYIQLNRRYSTYRGAA
jgi:uncharacterized membrane protein YfhO